MRPIAARPSPAGRHIPLLLLLAIAVGAFLLAAGAATAQTPPGALQVSAVPGKFGPLGPTVRVTVRVADDSLADDTAFYLHRYGPRATCPPRPARRLDDPYSITDSPTFYYVGRWVPFPVPARAMRLCAWILDNETQEPLAATHTDVVGRRGALGLVNRKVLGKRALVPAGWERETVDGGGSAAYVTFEWPEAPQVQFTIWRSVCACDLPRRAKQLIRGRSKPYMGRSWMARIDSRAGLSVGRQQLTRTTVAILHKGFGNGHSRLTVTYPPAMKPAVERMLRRAPAYRTLN